MFFIKKKYFFFLSFVFFISTSIEAKNVVRYATADDLKEIKNANIGDLLITGGTETFQGLPAIYIHLNENWSIKPGKKNSH